MKKVLQQLIIDWQNDDLPDIIARPLSIPSLDQGVRKAVVFMGMRRSGKTYMLYQHIQHLIQQGCPKSHIIYLNFEDDRLYGFKSTDWQLLLEAYQQLYPEVINNPDVHFFLDEIHVAEGWEKFIRRLLDKEKMQIYLSGSSSKMLSTDIATTLRGRTLEREVFPFSFNEYCHRAQVSLEKVLSSKHQDQVIHAYRQYCEIGGFAEVFNSNATLRKEILQNYIDTVIYKDIVERYEVKNTVALKYFVYHSLRHCATLMSINKIYNRFKSQGIKVSRDSLYQYLEYLNEAYCLFTVPCYTLSSKQRSLLSKKIYPIDSSIIWAFTLNHELDQARYLETNVYLYLRRFYRDIYYYRNNDSTEVDFLVLDNAAPKILVQACLSIRDTETYQREVMALQTAMQSLQIDQGWIVTEDEEQDIKTEYGTICVVPYWKWILSI